MTNVNGHRNVTAGPSQKYKSRKGGENKRTGRQ